MHLGNAEWIVVDSCLSDGGEPVALTYLKRLGLDPAVAIKRVIATHWHDDHILGIAKIIDRCPNAAFIMSGALGLTEFYEIVLDVHSRNRLVKHTSSASEFHSIFEILESRASIPQAVSPGMYAQDGSRVYQGGYAGKTEVWALSPSAATITNAKRDIASQILTPGTAARRFKRFSPNDLSVALFVNASKFGLLLGADLENRRELDFGWNAVLASQFHPIVKSEVFKIPHHGSANGDHPEIWTQRLVAKPVAVVTPYVKLAEPLPTRDDLSRLKSVAGEIYCTTWPHSKKPKRRSGVDGVVGAATRVRRAKNTNTGHIRMRVNLDIVGAPPVVELFGSAKQL